MHIDKSVKHSTDTARLTKKFEKKLGYLVCRPGSTPDTLQESMQGKAELKSIPTLIPGQ